MEYVPLWARQRASVIALIAAVIGGIVLVMWASGRPTATSPSIELSAAPDMLLEPPQEETAPLRPPDTTIVVYISGAVQAPDVYVLPESARVKDLVLAAGGLTEQADAERMNLAERLADGQHVQVARRGDETAAVAESGESEPATDLVDLNSASAADLDDLPGIGEAIAQRIVDYRSENGPFSTAEDLLNVKGIGGSLFEKIAPLVLVGSAAR